MATRLTTICARGSLSAITGPTTSPSIMPRTSLSGSSQKPAGKSAGVRSKLFRYRVTRILSVANGSSGATFTPLFLSRYARSCFSTCSFLAALSGKSCASQTSAFAMALATAASPVASSSLSITSLVSPSPTSRSAARPCWWRPRRSQLCANRRARGKTTGAEEVVSK